MKQELFFIKLLAQIVEGNERANEYFLYSIKYVDKILIFIYHDCARIYEFNQFDESIKVKSYYTRDFTTDERNKLTLEFDGQKKGYPQNKINFQQFIIDMPMDEINGKLFEKEYKYEDL